MLFYYFSDTLSFECWEVEVGDGDPFSASRKWCLLIESKSNRVSILLPLTKILSYLICHNVYNLELRKYFSIEYKHIQLNRNQISSSLLERNKDNLLFFFIFLFFEMGFWAWLVCYPKIVKPKVWYAKVLEKKTCHHFSKLNVRYWPLLVANQVVAKKN